MPITSEVKLITPTLAMQWLEGGNIHNRPVRQTTVMKYARDMACGRWRLSHQGIAFTEDGVLIDGQHRLWAIVEGNHAIKMMVTRGLALDTQDVVDGGIQRSARDVIALRDGVGISNLAMGVARIFVLQAGLKTATRQEQVACYDLHKNQINSALSMFPGTSRGIRVRQVIVPVVRALYNFKYEQIAPAIYVLNDGMANTPLDRVMILLRNVLLQQQPSFDDAYFKTERALMAYLTGDPITVLVKAPAELFPIPGEKRKSVELKKKHRIERQVKRQRVNGADQDAHP